MLVSSNLFKKSSKSRKVRCEICANYCKIADGSYGICKQHKNINGELFDESFGVVSSLNADPIEKKPLYHFLPGTLTYSVGGFGCNMGCLHCQNYMIKFLIGLIYFQKQLWKMQLIKVVSQLHGPIMNLLYIYPSTKKLHCWLKGKILKLSM